MKHQDIFNKVATHFFEQGWRSESEDAVHYHHPDGPKCAVGCLIDEPGFFNDMLWNRQIKWLIENHPEKDWPEWMKEKETLGLLGMLQSVHDKQWSWSSTEQMRKALTKVAEAFKLDAAFIDKLEFSKERKVLIEKEKTWDEMVEEKLREKGAAATGMAIH